MKVLLFTDADVFAGTEAHILELARGLRTLGVEAVIGCPSPAALATRASAEGIPVVTIQKGGLIDRPAIAAIATMLRSGQCDIVHAHNGRTRLSTAIALSQVGQGALVATQHFMEPNHATQAGLKGTISHYAHRWVNRNVAHTIATSNAVRAALLQRGESTPERCSVIPHGISAPLPAEPSERVSDRCDLGVKSGQMLIFCASRLEAEKGVDILAEAFATLAGEFPNSVVLVAGDGSQRPQLEALLRARGISDRFRLLGFRTDVQTLMARADIMVLPSLKEAFGLVLVEAMAAGLPVVATMSGGPAEIVIDGESGLLIALSDPAALANALRTLLTNPQQASRMGAAGRARFEGQYTAGRMAAATCEIYKSCLPVGH